MKQRTAPQGRRFRYADYLDFPDDGLRYEIIDGRLEVTPSPRPDHQRISGGINAALREWAALNPPAEVFYAPVDLILADDTILVPDLLVVLDPPAVTSRGIEAAPALVVEITSPGTKGRDRGVKLERYGKAGVLEYWIVGQESRTIEVYRLSKAGDLALAQTAGVDDDTITSGALQGLTLEVAAAFRDVPTA